MSDNETKKDRYYLPVINCENCLTGVQNVRQSAEGLLDIFVITVLCLKIQTVCRILMKFAKR